MLKFQQLLAFNDFIIYEQDKIWCSAELSMKIVLLPQGLICLHDATLYMEKSSDLE